MDSKELTCAYTEEKLKSKIKVAVHALDVINVDLFSIDCSDEDKLDDIAEKVSQIRDEVRDLKDFLEWRN